MECSVSENTRGAWYTLTLTSDAIVTALVTNQNFDAGLSLYSGSSCDDITCINSSGYLQYTDRVMTWAADAGTTYYLLVSGEVFDEAGTFDISIEVRIDDGLLPTPLYPRFF